MGRTNKEMHQGSMLGNGETGAEFIGLNGKVILKLLSVKIDDRLVNFAKRHIFKAFSYKIICHLTNFL